MLQGKDNKGRRQSERRDRTHRGGGGELYTCISRIGGGLHTEVSPVCTASLEGKFLEVEPEYVWLQEANQFEADVDVHSNAEWRAG